MRWVPVITHPPSFYRSPFRAVALERVGADKAEMCGRFIMGLGRKGGLSSKELSRAEVKGRAGNRCADAMNRREPEGLGHKKTQAIRSFAPPCASQ